jgi:hypothetical protein
MKIARPPRPFYLIGCSRAHIFVDLRNGNNRPATSEVMCDASVDTPACAGN